MVLILLFLFFVINFHVIHFGVTVYVFYLYLCVCVFSMLLCCALVYFANSNSSSYTHNRVA